ncbi:MAG TPA: TolC family protein [Fibrobacteria bacterium]|nr:TolC family protein [Fibrobacteria bacterium]
MQTSSAFFSALAVTAIAASAGPALTLEQAMDKARGHHPGFRILDAEIEALEGIRASASAAPNPSLTVGPGIKRASGEGASKAAFHGELGLEQVIEFPGKRSLRALLAEGDVRLRKIALEGFALEMRVQVRRVFFRALAAGQIAALRTEQVRSAETFLQAARKRVAGGYASDFETVKAQADWIAARKALGEALAERRQSRLELSALMGTFPDTAFALEGTLVPEMFPSPRGDLTAMALAGNPAVRARALQAELADGNIRAAGLAARPDVSVSPSLEYTREEQVFGVDLSLPLPLWDRGKGGIRKASAERRAAQAEWENAKREVALAVEAALDKVRLAEEQLALYTPEFLASLGDILQRAEKVYGQSSTTMLIYLEARRSYFESLAEYHRTLAGWAESHVDLEAAMGIPMRAGTERKEAE